MTHWASRAMLPTLTNGQWSPFPVTLTIPSRLPPPPRPQRQLCLHWMLECPQEAETPTEPPTMLRRPGDPGPRPGPFLPHPTPQVPADPCMLGSPKASSILILPPGAKQGPRGREEPQGQGKMVIQASGGQWSLRDSVRTVLGKTSSEF